MKYLLVLTISLMLGGCAGMVYSDIKGAYVSAKVIYQDAKFVVHEIEEEKKSWKDKNVSN